MLLFLIPFGGNAVYPAEYVFRPFIYSKLFAGCKNRFIATIKVDGISISGIEPEQPARRFGERRGVRVNPGR
jgi:hypothetical protein